jgi:hypothetical protein
MTPVQHRPVNPRSARTVTAPQTESWNWKPVIAGISFAGAIFIAVVGVGFAQNLWALIPAATLGIASLIVRGRTIFAAAQWKRFDQAAGLATSGRTSGVLSTKGPQVVEYHSKVIGARWDKRRALLTLTVRLNPGRTFKDLADRHLEIAAHFAATSVEVNPGAHPGIAVVSIFRRDPLGQSVHVGSSGITVAGSRSADDWYDQR